MKREVQNLHILRNSPSHGDTPKTRPISTGLWFLEWCHNHVLHPDKVVNFRCCETAVISIVSWLCYLDQRCVSFLSNFWLWLSEEKSARVDVSSVETDAVEQRKRIKKYEVSLQQYQLREHKLSKRTWDKLEGSKEWGKKKSCQCKNILERWST